MNLSFPRYRVRTWLLFALVLVLAGWGMQASLARYHLKRFQELRPGVFYRVAQPTEWGLRHLIEEHHIRTIVSLQLYDFRLHKGMVDPWGPSGMTESECVAKLGAKLVQFPMGDEAVWPWPTPWEYEAFFKLIDDPANLPVAIHCMGGRHRTGTLAALFRMEYDRWPADKALEEMHSFSFGETVQMQEANLRTYLPRPHPSAADWTALVDALGPMVGAPKPKHYEELVRRLRSNRDDAATIAAVHEYLVERKPFALPLAQRLIDQPSNVLAPVAAVLAAQAIQADGSTDADYQMAAALVADFGAPREQRFLLDVINFEIQRGGDVSRRYAALVAGLGDRFTQNRVAYLAATLADERPRAEPVAKAWRYCDTAVARISSITDQGFLEGPDRQAWNEARHAAQQWLAANPRVTQLSPLTPPTGHKLVRAGDGLQEEDLSRLK